VCGKGCDYAVHASWQRLAASHAGCFAIAGYQTRRVRSSAFQSWLLQICSINFLVTREQELLRGLLRGKIPDSGNRWAIPEIYRRFQHFPSTWTFSVLAIEINRHPFPIRSFRLGKRSLCRKSRAGISRERSRGHWAPFLWHVSGCDFILELVTVHPRDGWERMEGKISATIINHRDVSVKAGVLADCCSAYEDGIYSREVYLFLFFSWRLREENSCFMAVSWSSRE